ncbi:hypothetical protein [Aeromicrobium sp. UC242_57]|uniref:hypothetical protein n=1 Tax=Aeromicrobium sp. UC242_57 TaxID=3374624 RepID=UPI0037B74ABF
MRATRLLLVLAGVGLGLRGLWLMRDFTREQLTSEAFWLAGGVLLHDALLAPVVVVVGVLAARLLPASFRASSALAFFGLGNPDHRLRAGPERPGRQARQRHDPGPSLLVELDRHDADPRGCGGVGRLAQGQAR